MAVSLQSWKLPLAKFFLQEQNEDAHLAEQQVETEAPPADQAGQLPTDLHDDATSGKPLKWSEFLKHLALQKSSNQFVALVRSVQAFMIWLSAS